MQKIMLGTSIILSSLLLSACATTMAPPLADSDNVSLGQKAYVDGPIVEPVAIIEDSRCPMNARCIWAGRVRLKMIWHRGDGRKQPFEAELGKAVHLADGQFTLAAVRPDKMSGAAIDISDYRFSFTFAGGL
ncbi:hypothetical protein [Sphingopyxis sp. LK2115]|jgi:hypothetical protein|uniref:hypothetical protein n=1 Tax=Sphingopyxis sp. LK2115 TaxID=2744558 RepID=UPI001CB71A08|nr:hypothetical protein [Sphingopyxis sp. LK2115]